MATVERLIQVKTDVKIEKMGFKISILPKANLKTQVHKIYGVSNIS